MKGECQMFFEKLGITINPKQIRHIIRHELFLGTYKYSLEICYVDNTKLTLNFETYEEAVGVQRILSSKI